jgi:hypothetical protein
MHPIQVPDDPTLRAHLMCRVLRSLAVPHRVDSTKRHWLAINSLNLRGDPRIKFGNADTTTRRLAWALWCSPDGYLGPDWVVRTTCGIPQCCRPDHLELVKGAVSGTRYKLAAVA